MNVIYGEKFRIHLKNYPKADLLKIKSFVKHIKQFGFEGLQGRNKSSDNVPKDDPNWSQKVAYAQKHKLWHYHIGIPKYSTATNGEQVSEYVLHYILQDDYIVLVDLSAHPPFELPSEDYLT